MSDKPKVSYLAYKIRRKTDGLYSNGGNMPSFTVNGKTWKNFGGLTNHVKNIASQKTKQMYIDDCELIVLDVTEVQQEINNMGQLYEDIQAKVEKDEKRKADRKKQIPFKELNTQYQEFTREQRRLQYEKLKKEFEPQK